jgi:hypothetical protein
VTVGRTDQADVTLDDTRVSRVHCNRPDLPVPKSSAALGRPAPRRVASSLSGRGVHDVGTAAGTGSPRPAGPQATFRSARAW